MALRTTVATTKPAVAVSGNRVEGKVMKRYHSWVGIFLAFCFAMAAAPVYAQATRTWVSGVGDDANPCSRTAPCKTFAGAISKTAAGGEINEIGRAHV